jgi:hypothetical protein
MDSKVKAERWPSLGLLALGLAAVGAVALHSERTPVSAPGAGCPAGAARMARLELIFGMGRKGLPEVTEAEWQAFLDAEVTPRFPDGLTVLAGAGQWRNAEGAIVRETSRTLIVWHAPGPGTEARIEAIRTAWKRQHAQESVLRADGTGCVGF